jgi:AraC-like DNA-binding protein
LANAAPALYGTALHNRVWKLRKVGTVPKLVFSSDALPPELDDRARFSCWRDFMLGVYGSLHISHLPDRPFSQRMEASQFDGVGLVEFCGTTDRLTRSSRTVAASTSQGFFFGVNRSRSPMSLSQLGREAVLDFGAAALGNGAETGDVCAKGTHAYTLLVIPHARLCELVAGAEDLVAKPLQVDAPTMRHLRRYLRMLSEPDAIENDPALSAHIGRTLTDLVALALGAGRDGAEIARMRGLRAARLREVVTTIKAGFDHPGFSAEVVARKLGLSPRYVRDLLQETGQGFTDRVLELRLQKARTLLMDSHHDRLKVIDIALGCGFNEVSYFNRSFRRRFGASPTQFRGGNSSDA